MVDYLNATVRGVTLATGQVRTVAGVAGLLGHRDGNASTAWFTFLNGCWSNGSAIYVSDGYWDTIRKIELATGTVSTLAGNPNVASGYTNGIGSGAIFRTPRGLWGDGTYLYVADSDNYIIRRIEIASRTVTLFSGNPGSRGTADGTSLAALFYQPGDLWGDGTNLYVVDGSAIRKIVIATGQVSTLAGSPAALGYADGRAALFRLPGGLWGDGTSLFVADTGNHLLRKVDIASGLVSTLAGSYPLAGSENGRGVAARFTLDSDIWGNGSYLYVSDSGNNKLRKAAAPPEPTNPSDVTYTFGLRGGLTRATEGTDSTVRVGYGRIVPNAGSTTPSGLAIFGLRQNGVLVSEAAVPASALISSGRIYAEVAGPINTGLAISNPNSLPVTLTFYFTDGSGANINAGTTTIPANQQIAKFLNQEPFVTSSSTSLAGVRTFTFTSSLPVSVVALRGFTNERSDFLITTLPVIPVAASTAGTLAFPHFADGGGWKTELILVNPTDAILTGSAQFLGQGTTTTAGTAQTMSVNGTSAASFDYSIPARSSVKLQTAGSDPATRSGWVRVTPAAGTSTPSGLVVFSFRKSGISVSEAGVQALPSGSTFRLYAQALGNFSGGATGSIQTGVAISNPSSSNVTVNFDLAYLDGRSTGLSGTATIPANGQIATFLDQIVGFASLQVPFQGTLRFGGASVNVVGLRARYNEAGDFLITTTPPVDESVPASTAQTLFPHFVDGGGYSTEFILFSGQPSQSPGGILRFYGQDGKALSIQTR